MKIGDICFTDKEINNLISASCKSFYSEKPERFDIISSNAIKSVMLAWEADDHTKCMFYFCEDFLHAKFIAAYYFEEGTVIDLESDEPYSTPIWAILWDTVNEEYVVWISIFEER